MFRLTVSKIHIQDYGPQSHLFQNLVLPLVFVLPAPTSLHEAADWINLPLAQIYLKTKSESQT